MNKSKAVTIAKDIIVSSKISNLEDLLKSSNDYEAIISSLIYALGYESVNKNESSNKIVFCGSIGPSSTEIVTFEKGNSSLTGKFKRDLEKTFELVFSIESELTEAMLYPQNLRQEIIKKVQSRIGVSQQRYETVLKNWKTK